MKRWLLAAIILPTGLLAQPLVVEYSTFYSHLRKLQNVETDALQFAFGFKKVQSSVLCHIDSAYIHTQKQNLDIDVSAEQRFSLPTEKILKLARAEVILELQEPANQCDMSVQLETKSDWLKTSYKPTELNTLYAQYETFFADMGSFLAFLMPSVTGLTIHFTDPQLNVSVDHGLHIEQGKLALSKNWLANNKGLTLPVKPLRITANVSQ